MHQTHFVTAASDHQALPNSSGSFAMFAAIRRASLRRAICGVIEA
jgi:hypothetical protein